MSPMIPPEELFGRLAGLYQEKFMDVSRYDAGLRRFAESLPAGASVLELACGPGNVTRHLLGIRPDLKIHGSDLAPEMVELARANNPGATFSVMDARDLGRMREQFDGIVVGFLLPYLDAGAAEALVRACASRLRAGGLLYLSAIEDDPALSGPKGSAATQGDAVMMYYHRGADLCDAMARAGLEVVMEERMADLMEGSEAMDWVGVGRRLARAL